MAKAEISEALPRTKVCPACAREFANSLVVCSDDATLLMPSRSKEHRWAYDFPYQKVCDECNGCFGEDICPDHGVTMRGLRLTDTPVIDRKWQIVRHIGDGRLTRVFEVKDLNDDATAVMKVLLEHLTMDRKTAKRFIAAVNTASDLNHVNIAKIFAGGLLRDQPYLTMEYIDGHSLQEHVEKHGRTPEKEAVKIFKAICKGLAYAHKYNTLHNNLTLSNIYLANDGTAKIVDFGVAERLFRDLEWDKQMTHTASLYGTGFCLSPEYCKEGKTTEQCDIYSLGCIMYEVLSGEPVFKNAHGLQILWSHMTVLPPAFEPQLNIPDWLEKIVLRCLAKEPSDRFKTVNDLYAELMLEDK